MIIYNATKASFQNDILNNNIEDKIQDILYSKTRRRVSENEVRSWKNSLIYMNEVISDQDIPNNSSVAIEYGIPQSAKRIDFIIAGQDSKKNDSVVIVELKQWDYANRTNKDAIVKTFVGGREREVEHPSYQAWTYASLLRDYNEILHDGKIKLQPCAYLHNLKEDDTVRSSFYEEYTNKAPIFIRSDAKRLRDFIKSHVVYGDKNNVLYKIENGKIKPSKLLADTLLNMLKGNQEFLMIDEQKLIYETIKNAVLNLEPNKKVIIVEGGPGTGKSVLAINLLVELTRYEKVVQYVSKNSAPREVFKVKLKGYYKKGVVDNLFKGSGGYFDQEENVFDTLLVDEAHRLNEKSGMFNHLGENQIKEIILSSKVPVFFVDDDQIVTFKDIGRIQEIKSWAKQLGANVEHYQLTSQFRCNGSTAYTSWLDHVLDIKDTANFELDTDSYDFRVFDNPNELRAIIEQKNLATNKARIVAGYCWDWISKKDSALYDIQFPDFDFKIKWNLADEGMLWILGDHSVSEAGCIHTCQGLELEYVGVILGNDILYRDGAIVTNPEARARTDKSISGYKKLKKVDPISAAKRTELIIKNTYKTLMTRGQKGCFIYHPDKETREYFKNFLNIQKEDQVEEQVELPFEYIASEKVIPFENAIPLLTFKVAAGGFSPEQFNDEVEWVSLPEPYTIQKGYFVAQVIGESMNKKIPNGSWCLFKSNPAGTRQGKIVVVEHYNIQDQDGNGRYTIKTYHSQKIATEDSWIHTKIILKPNSFFSHYDDIVLEGDAIETLNVIGEFVSVLG